MIYKKELIGIFSKEAYIGEDCQTLVNVVIYNIYLFGIKIGKIEEITKN